MGRVVNLERPLRADDRLGGHFVLGHVDGVGTIRAYDRDGDCYWLEVEIPGALRPYLIPKGSIALDGISLTIAALLRRRACACRSFRSRTSTRRCDRRAPVTA